MLEHKGGRPPGSRASQAKSKIVTLMSDVLFEGSADEIAARLRDLRDSNLSKYLEIMAKLLPKDQNIGIYANEFEGWSREELERFIATGEEPERD